MPRPPFPHSIPEFYEMFPDETAAFRFIVACRWPDGGFECPVCASTKAYARSDRFAMECAGCGRITSATAGTVMHKSSQPLRSWLLAAWLLVTDKGGISAKNLQRQLGIKRYETAFQMLHKLRAGMVAPERTKLDGAVEVDETLIGGKGSDKYIVAGAVEVRVSERTAEAEVQAGRTGRAASRKGAAKARRSKYLVRPGRIRFRHVTARSEAKLVQFVKDVVEPGAMVITDGLSSYGTLEINGYVHNVESHAHGMAKKDVLKYFHTAVSNLKTYLLGTYHGSVSGQHLQAYLNEYTFRFNRRDNLHAAFQRILGIGTHVRGPEYAEIYGHEGKEWVHANPAGVNR